ncbi:hypothetical protein LJC49_05145 [Ruminococcaceae bacterium OttesenSCG-928-I18]|nr:hypothetical protein [Ruminococcaceae bacterium OttesenSCG-928-I18]
MDAAKDGFYEVLSEQQILITNHASQLPTQLMDRLEEETMKDTIESIVVQPMKRNEEILGFVGFDDDYSRQWMPEEILLLHNLCLMMLIKLNTLEKN